jgi:hypothetical protein
LKFHDLPLPTPPKPTPILIIFLSVNGITIYHHSEHTEILLFYIYKFTISSHQILSVLLHNSVCHLQYLRRDHKVKKILSQDFLRIFFLLSYQPTLQSTTIAILLKTKSAYNLQLALWFQDEIRTIICHIKPLIIRSWVTNLV